MCCVILCYWSAITVLNHLVYQTVVPLLCVSCEGRVWPWLCVKCERGVYLWLCVYCEGGVWCRQAEIDRMYIVHLNETPPPVFSN